MNIYRFKILTLCSLLSMLGLVSSGCKDALPDVYQQEEFHISALNDRACGYLTRPLIEIDTVIVPTDTSYIDNSVIVVYDTSFIYDTMYAAISTALLSDLVDTNWIGASDSLIISTLFDSLSSAMDTLLVDTALTISYPVAEDTSYAFYLHTGSPGELSDAVFFVDDFVTIKIINDDGTVVNEITSAISLETISACTDIDTTSLQPKAVFKIRTRYVFELEQAPYLVQFIISDATEATEGGPFRATILWD